jgi:hypothetical protein
MDIPVVDTTATSGGCSRWPERGNKILRAGFVGALGLQLSDVPFYRLPLKKFNVSLLIAQPEK